MSRIIRRFVTGEKEQKCPTSMGKVRWRRVRLKKKWLLLGPNEDEVKTVSVQDEKKENETGGKRGSFKVA